MSPFIKKIFPKNFPTWLIRRLKIYVIVVLLTAQLFVGVAGVNSSGKFIFLLLAIELSFLVPLKIESPSMQWLRRGSLWGVVTASFVLVFVASGIVKWSFTELTQPAAEDRTSAIEEAVRPADADISQSRIADAASPPAAQAPETSPPILAPVPSAISPALVPVRPELRAPPPKPTRPPSLEAKDAPRTASRDDASSDALRRLRNQKPLSRDSPEIVGTIAPRIYATISTTSAVGLITRSINRERAEELKLPTVAGMEIVGVTVGSAASKAGLRTGDIILTIGGKASKSLSLIAEIARQTPRGQDVPLDLLREGQHIAINLDIDQLRN